MTDTDTATQLTQSTNGNTSNIRARVWLFTWNNYTEEDKKNIQEWTKKECSTYAINPEVGENGTPHLQGYIEFKNPRHFNALKKLYPKIHWEKARNKEAALEYCKKSETQVGECFTNTRRPVKDPLNGRTPKPFQKDVIDLLEIEADDRKIIWMYDLVGGMGKTSLAKHLCIKYPNKILYITGKANDVKYGIKTFLDNKENDLYMCIFDFCRSSESYISYQAIEEIKNGIFYNTKYESCMVTFNNPHVVIFANFKPDETKLSKDRWDIRNIGETDFDEYVEEI